MPPTDRLFFALLPDAAAAQAIRRRARGIQRTHDLRGELIETDRLHLSLQHLGNHAGVPASCIDAARRAASRINLPAFDVCLDRALTFKGRGREARPRPCVLKATFDDRLHRFHRSLALAMRDCGLRVQWSGFTPHITMFYDPKIIDEHPVEPVCLEVREFVIVHSLINARLPYELLGRWPLRGCDGARPVAQRDDCFTG